MSYIINCSTNIITLKIASVLLFISYIILGQLSSVN